MGLNKKEMASYGIGAAGVGGKAVVSTNRNTAVYP